MKIFIITYYDGNDFQVERQEVDNDTQIWELVLPADRDDIHSVVEIPPSLGTEHKVWLVTDGNFVEAK